MIEYILAAIVLAIVIILLGSLGKKHRRGSSTFKDHPSDYHGVYSHDSRSPDAEVYFPVLKDSTSIMPMNKKEEREKTETFRRAVED
jgi:FtsZ-interacting cell division protein ZipA